MERVSPRPPVERRTIAGIVAGVLTFLCAGAFAPEPACEDGWRSPSIGRRGACSHHGGVDGHEPFWLAVLAGSVLAGACVRRFAPRGAGATTPYGSLRAYEAHLRRIGIAEAQIDTELRKYR